MNRWTLNFNQRDIESEYRAHFAAGDSSERHYNTRPNPSAIEKHKQVRKGGHKKSNCHIISLLQLSAQLQRVGVGATAATIGGHSVVSRHQSGISNAASKRHQQRRRRPQYRYSGVFIDLFVSAFIFVVCTLLFLVQPNFPLSLPFLIYITTATLFLIGVIVLVGLPLLSRRPILPWLHQWGPRHILGNLNLFGCINYFCLMIRGSANCFTRWCCTIQHTTLQSEKSTGFPLH